MLLACSALIRIGKACESGEGLSVLPNAVNLLRFLGELDSEELFMSAWLPERILLSYEKDYPVFTEATKNAYRNALAGYCRVHKISEPDGAKQLAERAAKEERTIGSFLFPKKKNDRALYIVLLASLFLVFFCLSYISIGIWSLFILLPLYTASLSLTDYITSFFIKNEPAPRLKLENVPDDAKIIETLRKME
jgi:hypothetical protein